MPRTDQKRGAARKLWRGIRSVIIYFIIVISIIIGLPRLLSKTLNTPFPMAAITSGSMWPVLKQGDLVFIKGITDRNELAKGDIIVYSNKVNGTLTIHRIITLSEVTVVTQGDANFTADAPTRYEDIIGETVSLRGKPVRIPYLGSVTVYASNLKSRGGEGSIKK